MLEDSGGRAQPRGKLRDRSTDKCVRNVWRPRKEEEAGASMSGRALNAELTHEDLTVSVEASSLEPFSRDFCG